MYDIKLLNVENLVIVYTIKYFLGKIKQFLMGCFYKSFDTKIIITAKYEKHSRC